MTLTKLDEKFNYCDIHIQRSFVLSDVPHIGKARMSNPANRLAEPIWILRVGNEGSVKTFHASSFEELFKKVLEK